MIIMNKEIIMLNKDLSLTVRANKYLNIKLHETNMSLKRMQLKSQQIWYKFDFRIAHSCAFHFLFNDDVFIPVFIPSSRGRV